MKIPIITALITTAPDISEITFLISLKILDCTQKLLRFRRVFTKKLSGRTTFSKRKFSDDRCYASLVCTISEARAILSDKVIDLHERILGSIFQVGP